MANLKGMSVAELLRLRSDVDTMLVSKRDELHAQLAEIGGNTLPAKRGRPPLSGSKLAGTKVAPKYRHPDTGETWSGRGGTAGWLAAELKAGKKKEDFLIATAAKKSAVKRSKEKKAKKAR
jgi:DNA-binding protein H-NS